jgi:rubrerythrin
MPTIPQNSRDVFEMAMGMERIGKDFYDALASVSEDAQVRDFCLVAARDEMNHLGVFRKMRDVWVVKNKPKPLYPEREAALATLAKTRIQPDPEAVRKVAMGGSLKDALAMAIDMEQDAIHFYGQMLAQLPDATEAISGIVAQEKHHLSTLQQLAH